jgi:adenosylcobyric acid synthase
VGAGRALLGICGGYQMLGRVVEDPDGVESGGVERGLGLLPVRTRLEREKTTRRVHARFLPEGPTFEAYEIHMGVTLPEEEPRPVFEVLPTRAPSRPSPGNHEGHASPDGRVRGTYLHGLFDSAAARARLLTWAGQAFRTQAGHRDHRAEREAGYDLLADALESALGPRTLARLLRL